MATHRLRPVIVAVLALFAVLLAGAPAHAAGTGPKPYTATVVPVTPEGQPTTLAGGQRATLRVTIANGADQQQIGSANVTVPAPLTAVSTSLGTLVGQRIELRNLALAPGGSVVFDVRADVPCTPSPTNPPPTWGFVIKQANNFSGTGNDFYSPTAAPTSTWVGGCKLVFGVQPHGARVGQTITGTDFDPTGPAVTVKVVDGNGQLVPSSAPIRLALTFSFGTGTLQGDVDVPASGGVAEFGDLSINAPGSYRLTATSPGLTSAVSDYDPRTAAVVEPFPVQTAAVYCAPSTPCATEPLTEGDSTVQMSAAAGASSGFLTMSFNVGPEFGCVGYTELASDYASVLGPERDKLVVSRLGKATMNRQPDNGAAAMKLCFGAPYPFATAPGFEISRPDIDGDGDLDYAGVLGDCGAAPCVSRRYKNKAGDGIMEIRVAGGPEDPMLRR